MPRDWERHWPLTTATLEERETLIDTIGNLTLLTKSLNPAVSNGPWATKREQIRKHDKLDLNRDLPDTWDEKARSEEHTSELQSLAYLVCRLLLEKKKKKNITLKNCTK